MKGFGSNGGRLKGFGSFSSDSFVSLESSSVFFSGVFPGIGGRNGSPGRDGRGGS